MHSFCIEIDELVIAAADEADRSQIIQTLRNLAAMLEANPTIDGAIKHVRRVVQRTVGRFPEDDPSLTDTLHDSQIQSGLPSQHTPTGGGPVV